MENPKWDHGITNTSTDTWQVAAKKKSLFHKIHVYRSVVPVTRDFVLVAQ